MPPQADEEKDRHISRMEMELMELRNKNLAFELLFAELKKRDDVRRSACRGMRARTHALTRDALRA